MRAKKLLNKREKVGIYEYLVEIVAGK